MEFEECRIYKAVTEIPFHKVAAVILELTESGRDVRLKDKNEWTFLHHVADRAEKFNDPRAVPVVYQLCLAGIDLNATDVNGDTATHIVVRKGARRVLIALLRCGARIDIPNKDGHSALDLIDKDASDEVRHWFKIMTPGLLESVTDLKPNLNHIKNLLQSYCRTTIFRDGQWMNTIDVARETCNSMDAVYLLEAHSGGVELAVATLAGSVKRINDLLNNNVGSVDVCDHSYQYDLTSPNVPQPLLAAAWEQNNYDVVDALMRHRPDTSVLYNNSHDEQPTPLFFHVLTGRPKPTNLAIVHRILRDSNFSKRNPKGQTIVFEAMKERMSVKFIEALLKYGLKLSARDYKGRTVREYADMLGEIDYVKAIDNYMISVITEQRLDELEMLVVTGYNHITELLKQERGQPHRLCEKLKEDRALKEMAAYVKTIPSLQRMKRKLFLAVDNGDLRTFYRLAKPPLVNGQNKCGHTMLHRALLAKREDGVFHVIENFNFLVNVPDNMMRTPLHYACILFGPNHLITKTLVKFGAELSEIDVHGKKPEEYDEQNLTTYEYQKLYKDVTEFDSRVYLSEMEFDKTLKEAIKRGSLDDIKSLMEKAAVHIHDMSSYSKMLFTCIEHKQPDIAAYLIRHGANPEVWKQKEDSAILTETAENDQPIVSLHDKSVELGYTSLARYIENVRKERAEKDDYGHLVPTSFEEMANFGCLTQTF